jgi:hypothetical protein
MTLSSSPFYSTHTTYRKKFRKPRSPKVTHTLGNTQASYLTPINTPVPFSFDLAPGVNNIGQQTITNVFLQYYRNTKYNQYDNAMKEACGYRIEPEPLKPRMVQNRFVLNCNGLASYYRKLVFK